MKENPLNVFLCFDDSDLDLVSQIEAHCAPIVRKKKLGYGIIKS